MIRNLLFDLGGVIMDIRRENAVESLKRIGMEKADELLGEYAQKGPFLLLEEGSISPAEFRDEVRKEIKGDVTDEQIDCAFCDFLIGIPEKRLHDLESLREKGYHIFMLSNTNPIMWHSRIADEFRKLGHDMDHYFEGEVTSFEAGCCKPDEKIFKLVEDKFGICPDETIFFDDSMSNIEAARKLGFDVRLVSPGTEFINLL